MNQIAVQVPVLTFSGKEHSRSSLALDNNIELKSFIDVAFDERTKSNAMESKFRIEVEENSLLTNCQLFPLIIWLR